MKVTKSLHFTHRLNYSSTTLSSLSKKKKLQNHILLTAVTTFLQMTFNCNIISDIISHQNTIKHVGNF